MIRQKVIKTIKFYKFAIDILPIQKVKSFKKSYTDFKKQIYDLQNSFNLAFVRTKAYFWNFFYQQGFDNNQR